jgi:Icc-related predicted phosphoesterase
MKIVLISDSHGKHELLTDDLPSADLIIHAGDISSIGSQREIRKFLKWFQKLDYEHKIFIAGNHDWYFQVMTPDQRNDLLSEYPGIIYLHDSSIKIENLKFYGSPWQPEFNNWAFNLPRNGEELEAVWNKIPEDTDILITHCPPYNYNDKVLGQYECLGCEKLAEKLPEISPLLHVYGHIHTGRGHIFEKRTHYINASVLDESYYYSQSPFLIEVDTETKKIIDISTL